MADELRKKYDKMVAGIETAKIYDGRNKGVDVYVCDMCGEKFYTRYKDKGVTPFAIRCRKCGKGTASHDNTISDRLAERVSDKIHNWVRPTFEQLQRLSEGTVSHVLDGGLVLEEELKDEEAEVKKKFDEVQDILDSMQGTKCSVLFIGHEGNHFVIAGNPINIATQILFAMIRYPVVKDIIMRCVAGYEKANREHGDDIRNIEMTHLIEDIRSIKDN